MLVIRAEKLGLTNKGQLLLNEVEREVPVANCNSPYKVNSERKTWFLLPW